MSKFKNWKLMLGFIIVCLAKAFDGAVLFADLAYGGAGSLVITVINEMMGKKIPYIHFFENLRPDIPHMQQLDIFITYFFVIFLIRILFSPFIVWKEQQEKIQKLEADLNVKNLNKDQSIAASIADKAWRTTLKQEQLRRLDENEKK